uniref:ACD shelterin complex subunit and telomerase recruitment factor n=1 Tax=Cyprinus carpio TaxID=7962 RepID=A0A8C1GUP0_CYPCA
MAELEPWIEKLIQNYGQSQCETTVKDNVRGCVCDISDSQRMEHTDVCMRFMSDGSAVIPAVRSDAAWERLQENDFCVNCASYTATLLTIDYFASCQFYLNVNQMNVICIASNTTLSSVRDQIIKTWRSRREGSVSSASGVSLSSLLDVWHNDIIINILNDATEKITMSATYCPSVATPTHWHRERLHWRGQEQFIVPVPFLLIPEEQRELMTADPKSESELPNDLAPPPEGSHPTSALSANQTMAAQDDGVLLNPSLHLPEVLCGTGELSGDRESPWDMFTQEPALLGRPTSTQAQFSKQISGGLLVDVITLSQRPKQTQFSPSHSNDKSFRDPSQEQDKERALSPPPWLVHSTAPPSEQRPSASPSTKPRKVHSDGAPFSYLYHPEPQVATGPWPFPVRHLIQWAVCYLGTSDCADVSPEAGS